MKQKFLTFGFKDEYMHMFGIDNIGSIFHINKREQFAVTPKEIIKFERNQIIKRYRFHFSIGCFIDKYNMAAFITQNKSKLYIFSLNDMSRPLISNFSLDQTGIFHILYSPRSNCLITFGTGVQVWQLSIEYPNQSTVIDPTIKITLRSDFAYDNYETMILNQPSFDYEKEILFLPTNYGIKGFTLDGSTSVTISHVPAKITTPISYCQTNGKLLTSDPQKGVCLWDKNGEIKHTYTVCSSSIISINFINPEHAILMNCQGAIFILNLKTGRCYHIYTSPMIPNRLFLQLNTAEIDPIFVFVFNSRCVFKRIVIPWTLWAKNVLNPTLIRRVNKVNEAARILVQTSNSFVNLFSPKTAKPLTSASPKNSATTVYVFYDRGTFISNDSDTKVEVIETEKRDALFISMDDGKIYGFDTGFFPCQEVMKIDMKSTLITTCFYSKSDTRTFNWMYALASPAGEAFLCDYTSFRSKCKIVSGNRNPLNLFFHKKTEALILLFADEIVTISVEKRAIVARAELKCGRIRVSHLSGDKIYIGLENGQILVVVIVDQLNIQILNDFSSNLIHSGPVSSFAFGRSFWVSAGEDGTVIFWEYSFNSIAKINLPEPIYACEVINGCRDLVVGTKAELMVIKGETVFGGEIDEEIESIDNFDRKNDQLYSEIFTIPEEEEEVEESLLSQRKPNKRKSKNNIKRNVAQFDDAKLRKEDALNQMEKLNMDRKITNNSSNVDNEEKTEKLTENEEEEGLDDDDESDDDLQKENRKKRKRIKKANEDEKSVVDEKKPSKEKEDFLNDLFPKKKFVPPQEPKISPVPKRSRHEKARKVRSSRPDRRKKLSQQENGESNKDSQNDDEAEITKEKEPIQEEENGVKEVDQKETEKDQSSIVNKDDDEETAVIVEECCKNDSKREDVGTQGEVINTTDNDKENQEEQPLHSDESKEALHSSQEKSGETKSSQKRSGSKRPKTDENRQKASQTKSESHHQPKQPPQKNEKKNHFTSLNKSSHINLAPNSKQNQPDAARPQTLNASPRRLVKNSPQPLPKSSTKTALKAVSHKNVSEEKSKKNSNQNESQKVRPIPPISPSSRLLEAKNASLSSEKARQQIEANTRLYVCNLPQSNKPISIVTNYDGPSWHENGDTFLANDASQKDELFVTEESNESVQIDSSEKVDDSEKFKSSEFEDEDDGNDRLAEAVGRRCPGLIFTQAPKSIVFAGAVLPGAAWMRRVKVGSRLIKSTRPKVFSPIGKIEKSVRIRNSNGERSSFIQTPLDRIRNRQKYSK